MIGGGGSTANRAATEVIGTADDADEAGADGDVVTEAGAAAVEVETVAGDAVTGAAGAIDGRASIDGRISIDGRASIGLDDVPDVPDMLRLAIGARGAIGVTGRNDGAGMFETDMLAAGPGPGIAGASPPRKSLTRVSTSWLIEMLLVSQNAFSRS
jgi:hypothetical protein